MHPTALARRRAHAALRLSLLLVSSPGVAAEAAARFELRDADGQVLDRRDLQGNATISVLGGEGRHTAPTLELDDPTQPARVLVRMRTEPVHRYVQRRLAELPIRALSASAPQVDALRTDLDEHVALLEREQQGLLDTLSGRAHVQRVHHRFVHLTNAISLTIAPAAIDELRADPRVLTVSPDHRVRASVSNSVPHVGAPAVWSLRDAQDRTVTGHGVRVAILDTGVDYTHPDLGGCLGSGCKVVDGYDFVANDGDPMDDHGHGTHVAGIVAANGVLRGVAPDARLLAYKVLDAGGFGYDSAIIAALERAVDPDQDPLTADHADVINLSLGGPGAPDGPLSEAANQAVASGSVVVAAAGNNGGYHTIGSPGNAADVITVAASDLSDTLALFSSRGPIAEHDHVKPEITAPGVIIQSTIPSGGYAQFSGTSMAAPHVAGAAALLRQLDPSQTPAQVRSRLVAGAVAMDGDVLSRGAGRLDVHAASQAALLATPPLLGFGDIDPAPANVQYATTVSLRNTAAQPHTVELSVAGLPPGATIELQPAGPLTLAAGESREVQVTLHVDNTQLAYPDGEGMHFEASLVAAYDSAALRIPVVFHKSAVLDVALDAAHYSTYWLKLGNSDGSVQRWVSGDTQSLSQRIRLRPGDYHALAQLWSGTQWTWVMQQIALDDSASVTLRASDATHQLRIGSIVDAQGDEVGDRLAVTAMEVVWADPQTGDSVLTFGGEVPASQMWAFSAMPERFQVSATGILQDPEAPADATRVYLPSEHAAGLDGDVLLAFDARSGGKVRFDYADVERLQRSPLRADLTYWSVVPVSNAVFFLGFSSNVEQPMSATPFSTTVHAPVATETSGTVIDLRASEPVDTGDGGSWLRTVAATDLLGFVDDGKVARVTGFDWSTRQLVHAPERTDSIQIDHGGSFVPARIMRNGDSLQLVNQAFPGGWDGMPQLRDAAHIMFPHAMRYRIQCEAQASPLFGMLGDFQTVSADAACSGLPVTLQLTTSVDVLGTDRPAYAEFVLQPLPGGTTWSPRLARVVLLSDGEPSRLLDGDVAEVRTQWDESWGDPLSQATIEYRLDGDAEWQPLALSQDGSDRVAQLPILPEPRVASLRISAESIGGNRQQQTLNALMLLGKSPTVFADGFELAPAGQ